VLTSSRQSPWVKLGREAPYYGVLSEDAYLGTEISGELRRNFFESGEEDLDRFLAWIREEIRPDFRPRRALEYGCGVGRLLLPLSRCAGEVTGVDISEGMLEEAARNLDLEGRRNCRLFPASSRLDEIAGKRFDFILSYIVFQHIPPKEGLPLLRLLAGMLDTGGVGLLHIAISTGLGRAGRLLQRFPAGKALLNLLRGRKATAPLIAMYPYPMNEVLSILDAAGISSLHLRLTDHGGEQGVLILFEKSEAPPAC